MPGAITSDATMQPLPVAPNTKLANNPAEVVLPTPRTVQLYVFSLAEGVLLVQNGGPEPVVGRIVPVSFGVIVSADSPPLGSPDTWMLNPL